MSAHTPGPWTVGLDDGTQRHIYGENGYGRVVATLDTVDEHDEANARLIAAAPDLLRALKQATAGLAVIANHAGAKHPGCADQDNLESIRGFASECFAQGRAAIAKAEGK